MGPGPRVQAADGFGIRAALFYAALLLVTGIQVPFFPLWLETRGLDAAAVGIVVAAPMLVRVVAAPILTRAADRAGALRGALIALSAATAALYLAVNASYGLLPIFVAVAAAAFFLTPIGSLADAYTLRGGTERGIPYGRIRLWGSVSFIAANLGTGLLLHAMEPRHLVWLIVAALAAMTLAALALRPLEAAQDVKAAAAAVMPGRFRWTRAFVCIAVGASLIQASHAIFYSFSSLHWTRSGFSAPAVGLLWALGVAAEVALFAVAARLLGPRPPVVLVGLGAAGAAVRWIGMACDPSAGALVILQLLHALSFGATHLGSVQAVASVAPPGSAAAAQGDFATVQSCIGGACTMLAGLIYAQTGELSYLLMAALAAIGGIFILLSGLWPKG